MIRALIPSVARNKDVKSPQLDRLADDGMVFDRLDTTAICMASRASVMTVCMNTSMELILAMVIC